MVEVCGQTGRVMLCGDLEVVSNVLHGFDAREPRWCVSKGIRASGKPMRGFGDAERDLWDPSMASREGPSTSVA